MRADETSSSPEWQRPTDPGPNPRQRRTSTREGGRGHRGGRGRGRGGNVGGPTRKGSTPASQDTAPPPPTVVVDPPTVVNAPSEPSSTPKPDSRPQPTKGNPVTASEDPTSISSQTSARPPKKPRKHQQGRRPSAPSNNQSKLLSVQTSSRRASTEPSSPNPAKDLPHHLAATTATAPTTELKSNLDALVERVRAVAMDRPHTPGSHIDWADDDDSLPDLNDWGYKGDVAASVQPEEPPTSIPPIFEDAHLETVIPEVKVEGEGEPSPDETKSRGAQPGPVSDAATPTHKVQKIWQKRGGRLRGSTRTQKIPQALNLTDSVSQDPTSSPIQPTSATVTPHTNKPQGVKRQGSNQGQNSRNNQGRTNSRDNGSGDSRPRGRNGVAVASPKRDSFPAKPGPKVDQTLSAQSQAPAQSPDIAQLVTNTSTQSNSKPAESQRDAVSDKERKEEKPTETAAVGSNLSPAARNDTPHELEPTRDDVKSNSPRNQHKRNSYDPSHSRSHTYGGRTQSGPQPPDSAPTPNFPHHTFDINPTPLTSRSSRPSNLRQSPGLQSPGQGPAPQSAGFERHSRNHSSPSGVGGITRPPHSTRPVLTGGAFSMLAKSLGSAPGSPKKDPPVHSSDA